LPRLTLNGDPPNLYLPSRDNRHVPPHLAHTNFILIKRTFRAGVLLSGEHLPSMCKAQQLNQKKENEYSEHQLNRVEVLECK
jgi:hypothetical protein